MPETYPLTTWKYTHSLLQHVINIVQENLSCITNQCEQQPEDW